MTPLQLQSAAHKLYGRKYWKAKLADALHVDVATIHRMMHRETVPGPYEVAIAGMLDLHKRRQALEKEARKLLPRKFRKRTTPRKPREKKLIPYAGAEE